MPELVRLYIRSVLIGFAVAAVFAAVLIWQDVMGVGRLILGSPQGWIVALMLWVSNGIVFAGVQFGIRVMMMAEDDTPAGGTRAPVVEPVPLRVVATVPAKRAKRG